MDLVGLALTDHPTTNPLYFSATVVRGLNISRESLFDPGVVDENLEAVGQPGLYVCDMSVMPFVAAANPVRHLAAPALRLAAELV